MPNYWVIQNFTNGVRLVTILWENIVLTLLIILVPLLLVAGLAIWLILGNSRRKP